MFKASQKLKGTQTSHYDMVSLWRESLSTNTRLCVLYFRMKSCYAHLMLHQERDLPND